MRTVKEIDYPVFKPNQTLSAEDLNGSFDYLNDQGLLTRGNLIGTGIVQGLDVRSEKDKITVTKGCGITSDGHSIYIEEDKEFGYYKESSFACLNDSSFPKINSNGVYELLRSNEGSKINDNFLKEKIIVFVYKTTPLDKACGRCGNASYSGEKTTVTIHALAIERKSFVLIENDSLFSARGNKKTLDKPPEIPRLAGLIEEQSISSDEVIAKVRKCIGNASNIFRTILEKTINSDSVLTDFPPVIACNHYNFLCDIITAYEEFRQCGEKIIGEYRPSVAKFPCHLILGAASDTSQEFNTYRHNFRSAQANSDDYAELNWLWNRLVAMIEYFNPKPTEEETPALKNIRLTPSVYGTFPLSDRAVPYYYNKGTTPEEALLYDVWSRNETELGYWYPEGYYINEESKKTYLNYDLERYNFVRIEGHIGTPYIDEQEESVKKKIKDLVNKFHLPIEVVALRTGNIENDKCISDFQKLQFEVLRRETTAVLQQLRNKLLAISRKKKEVAQKAQAEKEKAEEAKKEADAALNAVTAGTPEEESAKGAAEQAEAYLKEATQKAQAEEDAAKKATQEANILKSAKETTVAIQFPPEDDVDSDLYNKLFAILDIDSGIAVSFLHWLDAARKAYQQCMETTFFDAFITKHPGIQHKAGVPLGGTFIIVYDGEDGGNNGKVIADFCLPYRVTQPD